MKAQMFIITMVFLIGLIFVVQNNLAQYNFLDLARSFEKNDLYILNSVKDSFRDSLKSSGSCEEAGKNLLELETFLEKRVIAATSIEIAHVLDCSQWGSFPLNLTIRLKSTEMDTMETIAFSNSGYDFLIPQQTETPIQL